MLFQHACRKTLRGRHLGRHVGATCLPQCARITAGILAGTLFLATFVPAVSVFCRFCFSSKSLGKGILAEAVKLRVSVWARLRGQFWQFWTSIWARLRASILAILGLHSGKKGLGCSSPWPWLARGGSNPPRSLQKPSSFPWLPLFVRLHASWGCESACVHTYIHTSMHTYIHTDRHGSSKPNSLANSGQILDLQSSLANPDLNMCRRVLVTAPLVFWPPGRWVILSPPTRRRCSLRRRASCHCERSRVLAAVGGWVGIFLRQKSGTLWLCQNSY